MIATIDAKLYLSMKSKAAHAWSDVHVSIRISIRNPRSVETIETINRPVRGDLTNLNFYFSRMSMSRVSLLRRHRLILYDFQCPILYEPWTMAHSLCHINYVGHTLKTLERNKTQF